MIKTSTVRKLLSKASNGVGVKSISNLWVKIVEDNIKQQKSRIFIAEFMHKRKQLH